MNQQPLFSLPESVPFGEKTFRLVLIEKKHLTFNEWARRIALLDGYLVTNEEYLQKCWEDETKWKEWCNACQET